MMNSLKFCRLLIAFLFIANEGLTQSQPTIEIRSGISIAQLMFEQAPKVDSAVYTIKKKERIDGMLIAQESYTKLVKRPFQVYIKQNAPNKGQEVLYVEGENNNKAIINPNGFPWINLKLQPLEGIMRNNQHHTIFQSGFDHVVSILAFLCEKYGDEVSSIVINNGNERLRGRACYSISFINPHYKIIPYQVGSGESTMTIANKFKLNEHMILSRNTDLDEGDNIEEGTVIQIPNDYSPRMELLIDQQFLLPVKMLIYDDLGLYEEYEYFDIELRPGFDEQEFQEDFKAYGF